MIKGLIEELEFYFVIYFYFLIFGRFYICLILEIYDKVYYKNLVFEIGIECMRIYKKFIVIFLV